MPSMAHEKRPTYSLLNELAALGPDFAAELIEEHPRMTPWEAVQYGYHGGLLTIVNMLYAARQEVDKGCLPRLVRDLCDELEQQGLVDEPTPMTPAAPCSELH